MTKIRIDKLLVKKGFAPSRERANALIMTGNVLVNDEPVTKAGTNVSEESSIRLKGNDCPYVSRGGLKLEGALDKLQINVEGKTILDIGASTGGFTDLCLKRGATKSYAIDVGTNQLAYSLRIDSRVVSLEKTNARNLSPEMIPSLADLAVIDVSFISILKVLPNVIECLKKNGAILAMVKPQFEVGRKNVGKGGVVRDETLRNETIENVIKKAIELGLKFEGKSDSPIKGPKGNQETFIYLTR